MTTKTHRSTDVSTDDIFIVILAIISIVITELISCFIPSPKKSLLLSDTNPSIQKKGSNSSRQRSTSRILQKAPSPVLVTSTETNEESCVATGFQPVATTQPRKRTRSQVGTTSQPTRKSRSGRSIPSASLQEKTK